MAEHSAAASLRPEFRPVRQRRFASMRAIVALMLREMATTYGRSPLGYLWAILEPVAGIALLTAIFSSGFRTPPMGTNFAIFYASGLVPFMLYTDLNIKIMTSLGYSGSLLVYPRVTFMDALLARFFLNGLTQLLVGYVIFTGILLLFDTQTVLNLPALGLAYAMALALAVGVGAFNCFLAGMFPSWARIWSIVNRPLFLISCIFFLYETVPEPWRSYLWYVPTIHIVGQARAGFYPYYDAPYVSLIYVFSLSLILLVLGLLFLRRFSRTILQQ